MLSDAQLRNFWEIVAESPYDLSSRLKEHIHAALQPDVKTAEQIETFLETLGKYEIMPVGLKQVILGAVIQVQS
jgi:hypothetical protein